MDMKPWVPQPLSLTDVAPLHVQIKAAITTAVVAGELAIGAKLPGTRDLAKRFGVHRLTVAKAIRALAKRGVLKTVPGKGIFVVATPGHAATRRPAPRAFFDGIAEGPVGQRKAETESLGGFVERSLMHREISFGAGFPPDEVIPADALRRLFGQVMRQSAERAPFTYAHPEGDPGFVAEIKALLRERGLVLGDADRVVVTNGCQEALSLCLACFFSKAKGLAVESPGYMGTIAGCRQRNIPMYPVPLDIGGMHPGTLERYLRTGEAGGIYTIPNFQNPTGITQQRRRRQKLLALAERYGALVIEDDIYADLRFGGRPIPPLKSLPGGERVIYLGSFSKSLAPGLRIGFLVATGEAALRLKHYKETWDISTNTLSQMVMAAFLSSGAYRRHLMRLRRIYKTRRDAMLEALAVHLNSVADVTRPKGGMHLWVVLKKRADLSRIEKRAMAEGVLFAPGHLFFPDGQQRGAFRLNFTTNPPETIAEGIARLSAIISKEMKI